MNILTVDIGGKSIKYTVFNNDKMLFPAKQYKISRGRVEKVFSFIGDIFKTYDAEYGISGIAISSPGGLLEDGYVFGKSAIGGLSNMNLIDELRKYVDFEGHISAINDGNAVAYADYTTVKKNSTIVSIAVGTSIGAGIIINGNLLFGPNGFAGEVGASLIKADPQDFKDFEISSHSGFQSLEKNYEILTGKKITGKEIFGKHENGELDATSCVQRMYKGIAIAIYNIAVTINPDQFFIAGGLSNVKEAPKKIEEYVDELSKITHLDFKLAKIKATAFGWEGQLYGAYKYFASKYHNYSSTSK